MALLDTIFIWLHFNKIIKSCVFKVTLVFVLLKIAYSNPCFFDYASNSCLSYIADRRVITQNQAAELRKRALMLYKDEVSPPSAVYDIATVAVACLASAGLLRPGLDSDCAACGPACTQESRLEICELYCVYNSITSTPITTIWPDLGFNSNCCEGDKTTLKILQKYLKYEIKEEEYLYFGIAIFCIAIICVIAIILIKISKIRKRTKDS